MNTINSAPQPVGDVDVDSAYQLAGDTRARFERDGFVRLPGVLSPATVEHFEPEITAKLIELNTMHLQMPERATYQKAFLQVTNLWEHSDLVRRFVLSQRLGRIAAELMGVDGVRMYHDQALYKEPDGGITPWHADQYYWPLGSDRSCTVWVPLQDTPAEMGSLEFAVGSQKVDFGRDLPISDESEAAVQKALRERDFDVSAEPYALGDVSYHQGWTFHRAGPNMTQTPRRVMTVIFIDADITVTEAAEHQQPDLDTFMPGAEPGQVPDTPLNPVIYRRS